MRTRTTPSAGTTARTSRGGGLRSWRRSPRTSRRRRDRSRSPTTRSPGSRRPTRSPRSRQPEEPEPDEPEPEEPGAGRARARARGAGARNGLRAGRAGREGGVRALLGAQEVAGDEAVVVRRVGRQSADRGRDGHPAAAQADRDAARALAVLLRRPVLEAVGRQDAARLHPALEDGRGGADLRRVAGLRLGLVAARRPRRWRPRPRRARARAGGPEASGARGS